MAGSSVTAWWPASSSTRSRFDPTRRCAATSIRSGKNAVTWLPTTAPLT